MPLVETEETPSVPILLYRSITILITAESSLEEYSSRLQKSTA